MKFGSLGSNKNNKKKATSRERKLAKDLGGKAVPASGAIDGMPGDVELENHLIDDKFTATKSYTISVKNINKISREAAQTNNIPVLNIQFEKGVANNTPSEWCLIPANTVEIQAFKTLEVVGKSKLLSVQMINTYFKQSLEHEDKGILLEFHGVALGVSRDWLLLPQETLKEIGYFNE